MELKLIQEPIKERKKKTFLKRKWYFRKYQCPSVKQKGSSSTLITAQENTHIEQNTRKENLENGKDKEWSSELLSDEGKVCNVETTQAIYQTQHVHNITPQLHDDIPTAGEMTLESYVTEDTKLSINKDCHAQGPLLHTIELDIKEERLDKHDSKLESDENCQPSEGADKPKMECDILHNSSQENGTKDSGETNSNVQINNVPNISSDKRLRPNYFVAIPVTNDEILDLIEDVQEHIVLKEPKLLKALIPVEKVHITILVAHLQTKDDVRRAICALLQSKKEIEKCLHGKPFVLPFHGIGQFNNQVIYIKITEHELLSTIAELVIQCFMDANVNITGSKDFKPHLTFMKLSKVPSLRRKGFRKICSELYKEYEDRSFGTEMFGRIDLCSMHKKNKDSGYYYCESSIFIDGAIPSEGAASIPKVRGESNDPVAGGDTCTDSLAKNADKISSDIADALTISQKEEIKEMDRKGDASNINLGEKSSFQSTPDLFPADPMASTAVDDGPEEQK
ncbi:uncharacterized protein [Dendrobates tinctorius]|uniref:uncharacterized protein isoform X2 n=1 Tax=Dendrobates tinctorius TaxID=92724 RepID=UPI003CC9D609